jgi:hypothetical protein
MSDASIEFDEDIGGVITTAATEATEELLVGREDNLTFQTIQRAHEILDAAARQYGYHVESIKESLELTEVQRGDGELQVVFGWSHPAAEYFEFGTSPHTIQGNPVLVFVWEDRHNPPTWVKENFERARSDSGEPGYKTFLQSVEVDGVNEIRFVRGALDWLRRGGAAET